MRLLVEHVDEALADNLAFLLRIAHAGQLTIEFLLGIHTNHIQS